MQIDELARRFSEPVRRRGEAYQRAGAVTIKQASPTAIRAVAPGTERYDVRIEVDDRTLVLSCSCPAFEIDGPCKHLWATALVADERRLLAAIPSRTKVRLDVPLDDVLDDDEDEDDDHEATSPTPSSVALRQPPGSPLPLRSRGEGHPSPRPQVPGRRVGDLVLPQWQRPFGAPVADPCRCRPRRFSTSSKWTRPARMAS